MVEKTKEKKDIPGFSQGVRPNAAARMVKLARPICPNSKVEMERTPEGKMVPKRETNPARQNCQMDRGADQEARPGWWKDCEERGHDPYFSTRVWYSKSDVFETDPETGEQVKTGERTVRHESRYPNIAQVAAHQRVNSGRGPEFKIQRHGFKRLSALGYKEVCQFRNCQREVKFRSNVGLYCGQEHAVLVTADVHGLFLTQITGKFEQGGEGAAAMKRARQLKEAELFADIRAV